MRILLVGGTGIIGKVVSKKLKNNYQVITAGRNSGDVHLDMMSKDSIESVLKSLGMLDGIVITAGEVAFKSLIEMTEEDFYIGIQSKLMGQINIVQIAQKYIVDNGSFTLTAGLLNHDVYPGFVNAVMMNSAIEGFVKSAALELPRGIRINAVSPGLMPETQMIYGEQTFPGLNTVSEEKVANAYYKSVASGQTGQIYLVH